VLAASQGASGADDAARSTGTAEAFRAALIVCPRPLIVSSCRPSGHSEAKGIFDDWSTQTEHLRSHAVQGERHEEATAQSDQQSCILSHGRSGKLSFAQKSTPLVEVLLAAALFYTAWENWERGYFFRPSDCGPECVQTGGCLAEEAAAWDAAWTGQCAWQCSGSDFRCAGSDSVSCGAHLAHGADCRWSAEKLVHSGPDQYMVCYRQACAAYCSSTLCSARIAAIVLFTLSGTFMLAAIAYLLRYSQPKLCGDAFMDDRCVDDPEMGVAAKGLQCNPSNEMGAPGLELSEVVPNQN